LLTLEIAGVASLHARNPNNSNKPLKANYKKMTIENFLPLPVVVNKEKADNCILTQSTECARSRRPSWQSPRPWWSHVYIVNRRHRSTTSRQLMLLLLLLVTVEPRLIVADCQHHYTHTQSHTPFTANESTAYKDRVSVARLRCLQHQTCSRLFPASQPLQHSGQVYRWLFSLSVVTLNTLHVWCSVAISALCYSHELPQLTASSIQYCCQAVYDWCSSKCTSTQACGNVTRTDSSPWPQHIVRGQTVF